MDSITRKKELIQFIVKSLKLVPLKKIDHGEDENWDFESDRAMRNYNAKIVYGMSDTETDTLYNMMEKIRKTTVLHTSGEFLECTTQIQGFCFDSDKNLVFLSAY